MTAAQVADAAAYKPQDILAIAIQACDNHRLALSAIQARVRTAAVDPNAEAGGAAAPAADQTAAERAAVPAADRAAAATPAAPTALDADTSPAVEARSPSPSPP
eukprot:6751904-Prymnesium_polylepis.1